MQERYSLEKYKLMVFFFSRENAVPIWQKISKSSFFNKKCSGEQWKKMYEKQVIKSASCDIDEWNSIDAQLRKWKDSRLGVT